ncbi:MAG: type II secretion system protein [Bacilli bacterium]|nr:type II secretion system protein [Bacilli bacterium]
MKNRKGFTLIELLAVITILGILMLVGIPAVSRIIENSRRDSMADTIKAAQKAVSNAIAADNIACGTGDTKVSATVAGQDYYIPVAEIKELMESGDLKSSWGGSELTGYILWNKNAATLQITYKAKIADSNNHGMTEELEISQIKRTAIKPNGASAVADPSSATKCKADIN